MCFIAFKYSITQDKWKKWSYNTVSSRHKNDPGDYLLPTTFSAFLSTMHSWCLMNLCIWRDARELKLSVNARTCVSAKKVKITDGPEPWVRERFSIMFPKRQSVIRRSLVCLIFFLNMATSYKDLA